ncbi:MAG: Rrf2 family cysteine metabolism transcriptional repressor [Verrucomicrobiales bacterium]
MKLPLKLEYACRVLIQLKPTFLSGEVRRVETLAESEKISSNYLVQILNELRTAGLVESRRGKKGGYILARDPADITLGDVVRATEGVFLQLNNSEEGESSELIANVWREIFAKVDAELDRLRLSEMEGEAAEMWHI